MTNIAFLSLSPDLKARPEFDSTYVNVIYHVMPTTSLSNRFSVNVQNIQTDAILHIDDDLLFACEDLDRIFYAVRATVTFAEKLSQTDSLATLSKKSQPFLCFFQWQKDTNAIVSPHGRGHRYVKDTKTSECRIQYHAQPRQSSGKNSEWSICLTKTAMMHKQWNEYYTRYTPDKIKEGVDEIRNGEDLAFQAVLSAALGRSGCHIVEAPFKDEGIPGGKAWTTAISSSNKHGYYRDYCLNLNSQLLGYSPYSYIN